MERATSELNLLNSNIDVQYYNDDSTISVKRHSSRHNGITGETRSNGYISSLDSQHSMSEFHPLSIVQSIDAAYLVRQGSWSITGKRVK